jgi:membrane dipeptidase
LEDVSKYPYLFAELVKRNWTEEEVAKVAGLNIIRVFKRTEEVCS